MVLLTAWSWGVACPGAGRQGAGGIHVANDDAGRQHGDLALCLGQGLEEGFSCVAEGDVGVDDI